MESNIFAKQGRIETFVIWSTEEMKIIIGKVLEKESREGTIARVK